MQNPSHSPFSGAPVALFITGPSGCGKTTLAQAWARSRVAAGEPWAILDKDLVGDVHGQRLLEILGEDPHDRDSPVFKREVRALDYAATLKLAAAQIEVGASVALPGPWTQELARGLLFDPAAMGLAPARTVVVWLALSETQRRLRIEQRGHSRDGWKLAHWDSYRNGLGGELPACHGGTPHMLDSSLPIEQLVLAVERIIAFGEAPESCMARRDLRAAVAGVA
jgi:predicted kinase